MKFPRRTYSSIKLPDQPILKNHVDDLEPGDWVYVEDEFGEMALHQVRRRTYGQTLIVVGRSHFRVDTGDLYYKKEREQKVLGGPYLADKRIHLGNGILFTEEDRLRFYKRRTYLRERWALIDLIVRSNTHDWEGFSDEELVTIVYRLGRNSALDLKVIPDHEPDSQQQST